MHTRVSKPAIKLYHIRYVVEGRGSFPVDMLRYDQSYPDTQSDSGAISDGSWQEGSRRVTLCTDNVNPNWQPKVERWKSFTWTVLPASALDERS